MTGEEKGPPLVEVARAPDLFKARILAGLLESHGITVLIPDEETIQIYDGAATIWEKGVRLQVRADRAEEAREILTLQEDMRAERRDEEE